ncbi:unnamed protein product [Caenorhabditis sp. 36 PRJEB53466]|nr:unnamed protein product [Caenorhabditis sp. 36 PRJEB53466]
MTENIDVVADAAPVSPPDDVQLTIRQAYQAESDLVFTCPLNWTIKQVKEHVRSCCDNHPAISSQRLLFYGACLQDEMILSNILKERSHISGEQIFFHLVIAQPYQATPAPAEVRRRNVNAAGHNPSFVLPQNSQYVENISAWQEYWSAYNRLTPEAQYEENQRLMTHYYSYAMANAAHVTPLVAPVGVQPQAAAWLARLGRVRVEVAANVGNNQAGNNNQGRVDLLEFAYRIFKLVLLFSAILLYSSFERFAVVLCAALFIYFIQLRRNHARNRAQAAAAAPAPAGAAGQPANNQEAHVNNNNNGENEGENTAPPAEGDATVASDAPVAEVPAVQQTGMQLFIATCYSFVTSFFASLVPDHPMPMDLN